MFKYPVRTALAVGLSMAQIGEFAFVLLSVASQLGLLPYQVYMLLMGEHSCTTQGHLRRIQSRLLAHLRLGPSALRPPACGTSHVPGIAIVKVLWAKHGKRMAGYIALQVARSVHSVMMYD